MLRFIKYVITFGIAMGVAIAVAVAYIIYDVSKTLPSHESLARYEPPVMTRIHAGDGSLLAEYARERRLFVPCTAIPERLVQAVISAEDNLSMIGVSVVEKGTSNGTITANAPKRQASEVD